MYSKNRLDYILVDRALCPAISAIGYCGMHSGAHTDHVYAYMDMDEEQLLGGIVNRPITTHSRDFLLAQSDKVKDFLEEMIPMSENRNLRKWMFRLARSFTEHGATIRNINLYNKLYREMVQTAKGAASNVGRRKYGYKISPKLTIKGRQFLVYEQLLD